ncbi:MAG: DJ-1/PfpI family protein [Myxococcales bacterium]
MPKRIAIVMFQGCQPLDAVGPFEVFAAANQALHALRKPIAYEPLLVAPSKGLVRGRSGLQLAPHTTLARLIAASRTQLHTLIVAGGAGAREAASQRPVQRLVREAATRAQRVASVCTGAFVLAHAGLLDGKRATTHWAQCERLAAEFPAIRVETAPIYVRDGKTWTSAGVTAGIDLSLALVEDDLGAPIAQTVARQLVVFIRRSGGQSQFSPLLSDRSSGDGNLRELVATINEHPERDWSVPALARRAHMSVRNFGRVFRAETGTSPADYVERVRVETARRLLESTQHNVDVVAAESGFGTPEALRRALARRAGISPREYRARFGRPARA